MTQEKETRKLFEKGLEALNKNQYDKALQHFEKVISSDPNNTMAWNNKGVALRKLGRIEEALESYNKALSIDPELVQALLNKARALKVLKKYDLSLFAYEEALELSPEHNDARKEREKVRLLLSQRAKIESEAEQEEQREEELERAQKRKQDLVSFLEESRRSITDSVEKIEDLFNHGIKAEAEEHRQKIYNAIISFNNQLLDRVDRINDEFVLVDFEEECRSLLQKWSEFKETQLNRLKQLQ